MNNERIPTVPQTDVRISTAPQAVEHILPVPQTAERIPTIPQGEGRIPTVPQHEDRVATVPQNGRVATVPQNDKRSSSATAGRIIISNMTFSGVMGGTYTIDAQKIISDDSGESQIYGCSSRNLSEPLVARVLKSITPSSAPEKLETRRKVIDFLMRISRNPASHILPLVDHGIIVLNNRAYFVEVYPFCEGGDLGQQKGAISYEMICKEVIPAINEALHTFHNAGFVHRDVKPDNLYRYKSRVVIGDFGITCDLRSDGFATDRTKTGTLGYYAPELMSQAALTASDYYSFGQTLWALYSGEMMYQNILRRYHSEGIEEQRNQINFSMMNGIYYGFEEIKIEESFFEILIRGLLQYDPSSRFDYKQVNRWMSGDKSLAHEITKFESQSVYKQPFIELGYICWDDEQLYELLRDNWDDGKNLLYGGRLKEFFLSHDYNMVKQIDRLVYEYDSAQNETQYDIGLSKLLFILNKGRFLVWRGVEFRTFKDFSAFIVDHYMKVDTFDTHTNITDLIASGLIGYWYELQNGKNGDKYEVALIEEARKLAQGKGEFYHLVAYTIFEMYFTYNPEVTKFNGCVSLDDVIELLCSTTENKYAFALYNLAKAPRFYGFLFSLGYFDYAKNTIQENLSDYDDVENLYSFLEQQTEDKMLKMKLVSYYRDNGPSAYLLWFKEHLDLYQFNGVEANELRKEIESFQVKGNSIAEIRKCNSELMTLVFRFRNMFVDDVYLARLGLIGGRETNGITSNHLNAYWHKLLYGRNVPIGFNVK